MPKFDEDAPPLEGLKKYVDIWKNTAKYKTGSARQQREAAELERGAPFLIPLSNVARHAQGYQKSASPYHRYDGNSQSSKVLEAKEEINAEIAKRQAMREIGERAFAEEQAQRKARMGELKLLGEQIQARIDFSNSEVQSSSLKGQEALRRIRSGGEVPFDVEVILLQETPQQLLKLLGGASIARHAPDKLRQATEPVLRSEYPNDDDYLAELKTRNKLAEIGFANIGARNRMWAQRFSVMGEFWWKNFGRYAKEVEVVGVKEAGGVIAARNPSALLSQMAAENEYLDRPGRWRNTLRTEFEATPSNSATGLHDSSFMVDQVRFMTVMLRNMLLNERHLKDNAWVGWLKEPPGLGGSVFDMFDIQSQGLIDYREFNLMWSLLEVNPREGIRRVVEKIYKCYDGDMTGGLSREGLLKLLAVLTTTSREFSDVMELCNWEALQEEVEDKETYEVVNGKLTLVRVPAETGKGTKKKKMGGAVQLASTHETDFEPLPEFGKEERSLRRILNKDANPAYKSVREAAKRFAHRIFYVQRRGKGALRIEDALEAAEKERRALEAKEAEAAAKAEEEARNLAEEKEAMRLLTLLNGGAGEEEDEVDPETLRVNLTLKVGYNPRTGFLERKFKSLKPRNLGFVDARPLGLLPGEFRYLRPNLPDLPDDHPEAPHNRGAFFWGVNRCKWCFSAMPGILLYGFHVRMSTSFLFYLPTTHPSSSSSSSSNQIMGVNAVWESSLRNKTGAGAAGDLNTVPTSRVPMKKRPCWGLMKSAPPSFGGEASLVLR